MPFATLNGKDGEQIHYTIVGEGPPILFLHGIFGCGEDWLDAAIDEYLTDFQLILVDMRGHGRSFKPHEPEAYLPYSQVEDIKAVLDDLGIVRTRIWGYSFGGRIAFAFGIKYPEHVEQIIVGGMHPYKVSNVYPAIRKRQKVISQGMKTWVNYLEKNEIPVTEYTKDVLLKNDHEALVSMDNSILVWPGFGSDLTKLFDAKFTILLYLGERDRSYIPLARKFQILCSRCHLILLNGLNHFTAFSESKCAVGRIRPLLEK